MGKLKGWPDYDFREFAKVATTDSGGSIAEGTSDAGFYRVCIFEAVLVNRKLRPRDQRL
jgi:hypothetical protein